MDASLWILLGVAAAALAVAYARDPALPWQGLQASGRLIKSVWLELALGFLIAGLIDVLVPAATLARFIPGVLLPPLMGWLGQWLYLLLKPE